jgi:hypothetical protein
MTRGLGQLILSIKIDDEMSFGTRRGEEEFNRRVLRIPRLLARAAGDESLARH